MWCQLIMSAGVLVLWLYGVDTVVSGVYEPVCGVNSVMSAGVDDHVCGVSSVMTDSELNVCGCDNVVSDVAGNSSRVEVVLSIDDVVLCGDGPLLPDAVRVGGWLSVVGDTLMCGAGVAQIDRGDTVLVVGPGVVQPG